jgi:uncharacterized protein (TIGR03435 family)
VKINPIFVAVLMFCTTGRSPAQNAATPAFEVASVRPNRNSGPERFSLFPEFTAQNATLKDLLALAYDVKGFQVSGGPAWINSDRYDISAKVAGPPTPGREGLMLQRRRLQTLLQDRFKLAVHRETKELPIYELSVSKGGPKLQAPSCIEVDPKNLAPAPSKGVMDYCGSSGFFKGRFEASAANMGDLAKALANLLDRSVTDKTGVNGTFHVTLTFAVDDTTIRFPDAPNPGGAVATDAGPNIFTALQEQLGLRLESRKGPVDVTVIDHVEKPSEN